MLKNQVQLIGNLGSNPEIKTLDNNRKMARFSIAVSENFTDKNGRKVENTNWFNIIAWGHIAEYIEKHGAKGKKVLVSGKLANKTWVDNEGIKRTTTEIVTEEVFFC